MSESDSSSSSSGSTTSSTDSSSDVSSTTSNETGPQMAEVSRDAAGATSAEAAAAGADDTHVVQNAPHDEEFSVGDGAHQETPRMGAGAASAESGPGAHVISNNPHDEAFEIQGEDGHTATPRDAAMARSGGPSASADGNRGMLQNLPNDEFEDVEDDMGEEDDVPTPQRHRQQAGESGEEALGGVNVSNMPHDAEFDADASPVTTNEATSHQATPSRAAASPGTGGVHGNMQLGDDSSSSSGSSSSSSDEGRVQRGVDASPGDMDGGDGGGAEVAAGLYNPAEYAGLDVTPEVQQLFNYITAYEATVIDCPAKLKPFVPDYIPCVGDIDTFCKVPRPDGKADNLGLVVVDEPSSAQSNPLVVKLLIERLSKVSRQEAQFVDSVQDAANRPEVINKWVDDIKEMQYQKPLTSVSYSKPMPDIEQLMQAWPGDFEEVLASDISLPPPNIDLDMRQYVRTLCALLDIPTHVSLVESLHVLFTLYLEFRENQHFRNA